MQGKVIWYHPELRVALIERPGGYTVGSPEAGDLRLGALVCGDLRHEGLTDLWDPFTRERVAFLIEANAVSEEEANELLGYVRDASTGHLGV